MQKIPRLMIIANILLWGLLSNAQTPLLTKTQVKDSVEKYRLIYSKYKDSLDYDRCEYIRAKGRTQDKVVQDSIGTYWSKKLFYHSMDMANAIYYLRRYQDLFYTKQYKN